MASYARKPNVVEAYQWVGDTKKPMPLWVVEAMVQDIVFKDKGSDELMVRICPDHLSSVPVGDYLTKGMRGSIGVWGKQRFEDMYQPLF